MRYIVIISLILISQLVSADAGHSQTKRYPWLARDSAANSVFRRFPPPAGYVRVEVEPGSFADWLRNLPLKPENPPIMMYNGFRAAYQDQHCAVVDMDVGSLDLQQCADAIIRLRAEYLYSIGRINDITFNFTSGDRADYRLWIDGYRPTVNGNDVSWRKSAVVDSSYRCFREYLDAVFAYAGTYSLSRDLKAVDAHDDIHIGDVFVIPGFPGHAVVVADAAVDTVTGRRAFILIQGFSPAQDVHVLSSDLDISPWYTMPPDKPLKVLWYNFERKHLRRF